jgi:hypothetical protein
VAFAVSILVGGCETDSTEDRIEITPGSVTLREGQSQTFTVAGGHVYSWSLDPDDGSGSLNQRQGDTVVFTLLSAGGTNATWSVIEVICSSTIPGVSGGTNDPNAYTSMDTAYVNVDR